MKLTSVTHICRVIKNVPIYALYPESFCIKILLPRKLFSDSAELEKHFLPISSVHCSLCSELCAL